MSARCVECVRGGAPCWTCAQLDALRAEVRDLKARLTRVRQLLAPCDTYDDCVECRMYQRITDLRVREWRKP